MTDARDITLALGGRWHQRYGVAPCPVCQPERRRDQNGLTLADGRTGLLLDCKKSGCAFLDVLVAAGITPGGYRRPNPATLAQRRAERRKEAERRGEHAKRLWREAQPIAGTAGEAYLRDVRGITCTLPVTLRFHSACWHGPTGKPYPAMVAAVQGSRLPAVHRTYLQADGSGKANISPPKAMLGATSGGAVRLTDARGPLVVAEGIETALSLASGLLCTPATVWAALSTSGMRGLKLPPDPDRLTIAPDGDKAGREAANILADRVHALGWQVSLLPAPDGYDWNDILTGKEVAA
ncbi:MAG: hypothetical protein GYB24_15690 [Rhodobacteraceae bacterium]|nr:hypothetical protein [Paracoccaceae bacterium]